MNTKKPNAARKLIADGVKNLQENEYNMRKMKGVMASHSDVETAILYAQTILEHGSYQGLLMQPFNEVRDLLEKYALLEASYLD